MKKLIAVLAFSLTAVSAFADIKPCEELKSEIPTKIDAAGAKNYSLEIVANDAVKDQIVGNCDGGTKKIVYPKNGSSRPAFLPSP